MKTQTSKVLGLAIAAAVLLPALVLAGATVPPQVRQRVLPQQAKPTLVSPASAQYRFVTIDAPDALLTAPYGVNNTGLVTGYYQDASGNLHGLLWRKGALKTLDNRGSVDTLLGDSSDLGMVIGNHGDATLEHAAMYDISHALWTTLPDIDNETANFGDGINNAGVATGSACNGNAIVGPLSNCVGWTWDEGTYSLFTAPDADETALGTFSNGLNNRAQVVGYFQDSSAVFHGFLKDGDSFTTIDVPGAQGTFPYDINDREEIVGEYQDATGASHGFTESHGRFTTVDYPGALGTSIFGNNDRGDLAGQWLDSAGTYHGFVAFKH